MKKSYVDVNGVWVEKVKPQTIEAPQVMDDIKPYRSMVDGTMITSRSTHREHLKDHNCIEIGNEKMSTVLKPQTNDNRKQVLREQLANMTHDQANKVLAKLRDDARFYNPHREK